VLVREAAPLAKAREAEGGIGRRFAIQGKQLAHVAGGQRLA